MSTAPEARRRHRPWLGLALCLVPAGLLATCSLGSGDDAVETESADAAATAAPATEPPTTDHGESSDAAASSTASPSTEEASTTSDGSTTSDVSTGEPAAISFATQIEPIITETCATCHTGNGPGTQHLRLDTAGIVAKASVGIEFVTRTGFMPPWPATDESVEFRHDWSLSDAEIALLAEWHEAGSPLDVDPAKRIEPSAPTARLEEPDIVVRSRGSYDGTLGQEDEYRCLVYDPEIDEASFVTGLDFIPDQEQVVHHAVGFLVRAGDRPLIDEIDGGDGEGGGWTCFGFAPAPSADLVYAWAPGQAATRYPEGTGLAMEAGDFFVVQTHYHFDVEAPADQSTLALDWLQAAGADDVDAVRISTFIGPAEIPCSAAETGPLCDRDAAVALAKERYGTSGFIPDAVLAMCGQTPADYAGFTAGVASSTCDLRAGVSGEIISIFGHEHELGTSFRFTLNPDTAEEVVLLDIAEWDFDWQLNYEPVESIVLAPNDVIRMECSWDRALRDPELEPAYIVWADGTDDEMCFASMVTRPL